MIPSNYHREEFYNYTAEADKNIYVVMQVHTKQPVLQGQSYNTVVSH